MLYPVEWEYIIEPILLFFFQLVVERMLASEGIKRVELGRDEFEKRVWEWKEKYVFLKLFAYLVFLLFFADVESVTLYISSIVFLLFLKKGRGVLHNFNKFYFFSFQILILMEFYCFNPLLNFWYLLFIFDH